MNKKQKKSFYWGWSGSIALIVIVVARTISFFNSPEHHKAYLKANIPFYIFIVVSLALICLVAWLVMRKISPKIDKNSMDSNNIQAYSPNPSNVEQKTIATVYQFPTTYIKSIFTWGYKSGVMKIDPQKALLSLTLNDGTNVFTLPFNEISSVDAHTINKTFIKATDGRKWKIGLGYDYKNYGLATGVNSLGWTKEANQALDLLKKTLPPSIKINGKVNWV